MTTANQHKLALAMATTLIARGWTIALAESCTGGLVCAALTDLAGSSDWFERGYITYSNQAKTECLGVLAQTIDSFGAVSEQVAQEMAAGAQQQANVNIAIAITGIAGPTGGSVEKPVGTVCFAWAVRESLQKNTGNITDNITAATMHFTGDRQAVREQARDYALARLLALLAA
ncbi:CinA family protein [Polynucleobacter brandtiae]|uniref:Nicotinamide-nucleotide amidase n=1 Tax=Polynucleobacter brandtiae TaxID=1938816 RepID=A0A2M8VRA3_9BURK|nr:CinA family protein [Polynucleobacter brandtiae]PJI80010.1 nicotinamide-nucleotide amidase [Polynucleobacter brandtiae]